MIMDNLIVGGQTEERSAGPPLCPLRAAWLLLSWPRKEVELACACACKQVEPVLSCACACARKQVEPGEERKTTNGRNSGEWWSSLSACVWARITIRDHSLQSTKEKESSNTDSCFVGGSKALFQSAIGYLRNTRVLIWLTGDEI